MSKPKVAFYWCASCGGCEEAVVDLAENILKVVEAVDIVLWPVALDFKYKDIEEKLDGEIAVSFINGAIRMEEQEEIVKLLRKKSQMVVAFGSCSHLGGIPGLANFFNKEEIMNRAYFEVPTADNKDKILPEVLTEVDGCKLTLPEFYDKVKKLDDVIDVDYYLPGCAPPPDLIMDAITAILEGNLPPKGTILSSNKNLCETCPRLDSKPDRLLISEFKRPHEIIIDHEKCFLAQGLVCAGLATRGGCGEKCIRGNMPCRGCFGPTDSVIDQGAKLASSIGAMIDSDDDGKIKEIIEKFVDPAGLFYRFGLPASILKSKK